MDILILKVSVRVNEFSINVDIYNCVENLINVILIDCIYFLSEFED